MRGIVLLTATVLGTLVPGRYAVARAQTSGSRPPAGPRTRAEVTHFTETSHYGDVTSFLDTLRQNGAPVTLRSLGTTKEGRDIPVVIASRPRVATPAEARALGRPIVYVNANIHAGEVEGKEAMLAMLRDLSADTHANVLDSLVLIIVPDYNADGNDKFAAQAINREEQNGPERVGTRANAMGLDLNRDYVKAEAPETRGALALFNAWRPDVYVDLHTTDGSYHGYALTYSPSLSPAAPLGVYMRDMLATLRTQLRTRARVETFDYGNFDTEDGERDITDSVKRAWYTYDFRPRFGTNYYGIRGGISILSEAFSHDPFERRVASTDAFTRAVLSFTAERAKEIRRVVDSARNARPRAIPLDAVVTTEPRHDTVLVERLVRTGDSALTQPGVPKGVRRTGRISAQAMPVYDRFEGRRMVTRPLGYVIAASDTAVLARLALHGIQFTSVRDGAQMGLESYTIDSIVHASSPFQGHHATRLVGRWTSPIRTRLGADTLRYVSTDQPLGTLAVYLLEPESADGLVTWNVLDPELRVGGAFPVRRVVGNSHGSK
jgi:hypothetical protein